MPILLAFLSTAPCLAQSFDGWRIVARTDGRDITVAEEFFAFFPRDLCTMDAHATNAFTYQCAFDGQHDLFTFTASEPDRTLVLEDLDMAGGDRAKTENLELLRQLFQPAP